MRVIVAGTRTVRDAAIVERAIFVSGFVITELVSGHQRSRDPETGRYFGVDYFAERWAMRNKVPIRLFPAEWKKRGLHAGPVRNRLMARNADALIAVWDGQSPGTKDMIEVATDARMPMYITRVPS